MTIGTVLNLLLLTSWLTFMSSVKANCGVDPCQLGQFCGTDLNCYNYSCGNFYLYGPEAFVGHTGIITSELSCGTSTADPRGGPYGVTWACAFYYQGMIPSDRGVGMPYNTQCTSNPQQNLIFECYEYAADTDFSNFENQVYNSSVSCPDNPNLPGFVYQISYSYAVYENGYMNSRENADISNLVTQNFIRDSAVKTIFASLTNKVTKAPTRSPTTSPPTHRPIPTLPPSGLPTERMTTLVANILTSLLLGWICWHY